MTFALFFCSLAVGAKTAAKVLLFCELTKFLSKKNVKKHHFLYKWLIINIASLSQLLGDDTMAPTI